MARGRTVGCAWSATVRRRGSGVPVVGGSVLVGAAVPFRRRPWTVLKRRVCELVVALARGGKTRTTKWQQIHPPSPGNQPLPPLPCKYILNAAIFSSPLPREPYK